MLILRIDFDETLHIGDDVTIKVIKIKNNAVNLGIEAPREIEVHRGKIFHAIKQLEREGSATN